MFQQAPRRRAELRAGNITDPAAIRAIASPVRQELVDTLEALGGTATIAELAEQLGRPADGLYYHVQILVRAGLFEPAGGGTSRAGRSERRYRTAARAGEMKLVYRPREPRNAAAVKGVVGGMLRIARRDFDGALAGDVATSGPHRELWAARGTGWMSDAELAEANRLLVRLSGLLRRPRSQTRQRLVSLCFVLAPMVPRAKRREPADRPSAKRPRRERADRPSAKRPRREPADRPSAKRRER